MPRPEVVTDLLQILKIVLASTLAWWISITFLDTNLPFLAPWVALMTIQPTVSSSLVRGAQTLVASAIGVLMSFAIGVYLGVEIWTYALALLVGMLGSRIPGLRQEGVYIATTAIFLLSTGFTEDAPQLLDRMLEIGLGVVVGVVVNMVLVPPLRDKQASDLIDDLNRRMGEMLEEMGKEFADSWDTTQEGRWTETIEEMRFDLRKTWDAVNFARESRLRNPRRLLNRWRGESYEDIMVRVDEGIAHLRNLARTLAEASYSDSVWDTHFRQKWAETARDAGRRIANPDAEVEPIADRLDQLARDMAAEGSMPDTEWPVYGALLNSLRAVSVVVDDVASAREARDAREN